MEQRVAPAVLPQEQSNALEFLLAEAAREQQQLQAQQLEQQQQGQEREVEALQPGQHGGRPKPQLVLVGATPPREALVERYVQQVRACHHRSLAASHTVKCSSSWSQSGLCKPL